MICGIIIINKPHRVFKTPKIDEVQYSYDFYMTKESTIKILDNVRENLDKNNVEEINKMKAIGLLEDFLYGVPTINKKIVENRLTIGISKDEIRILDKHNGRIASKEQKQYILDNPDEFMYLSSAYTQQKVDHGLMTSFVSLCYTIKR